MPKPGFYAVKKGRVPGVYLSWAECEAQVKGFPNASYKKFNDRASADDFAGLSSSQYVPSEFFDDWDIEDDTTDKKKNTSNAASDILNKFKCKSDSNPLFGIDGSEIPPKLIYNTLTSKCVYYAVHRGLKPGIYTTWTECEAQIKSAPNPSYRKFDNEEQALEYVKTGGIVKASKREILNIKYDNHVILKRKRGANGEAEYILANPDEPVVVFTDGASAENGKQRARAGIGIYWGPNHPLNASKRLSGRQTNNRAEIQAAIYALNQAKQIGAKKVKLYTDSQFLIHAVTDWVKKWKTNGWKLVTGEPVVNKEDFIELEIVSKDLDVEWIYVKAHANNHGNDEADKLAVAGSKLLLSPSNCSAFPKPQLVGEDAESFILNSVGDPLPLILPEVNIPQKTYYAVHTGKVPGVYETWTECEQQVKDCINPRFRKFTCKEEALEFVETGKQAKKFKVPEAGPDEFVTVYTDGASSCNGQDGAQAGIGVYWGPGNKLNTSMRLPGRQTNNRAEIYAAVYALQQAKRLGVKNLRLYTDSRFVIDGITKWIERWKVNGWKLATGKPVVNKDDFIALDKAREGINVDWCYVKGHSNIAGNVEADKLAVSGCTKGLSETIILV